MLPHSLLLFVSGPPSVDKDSGDILHSGTGLYTMDKLVKAILTVVEGLYFLTHKL